MVYSLSLVFITATILYSYNIYTRNTLLSYYYNYIITRFRLQ